MTADKDAPATSLAPKARPVRPARGRSTKSSPAPAESRTAESRAAESRAAEKPTETTPASTPFATTIAPAALVRADPPGPPATAGSLTSRIPLFVGQDAGEVDVPSRRPARSTRHRRSTAGLALMAIAVVALSAWLGYRHFGPHEQAPAQRVPAHQTPIARPPVPQPPGPQEPQTAAVLAAGQHAIETIGTFSYATVDADLSRILAVTTGELRSRFQAGLATTRAQIADQHLTKKATVLPAGQSVVATSATEATVSLLIESEDTSKSQPTAQIQRYRVSLTMAGSTGSWLVSAVTTPTLVP